MEFEFSVQIIDKFIGGGLVFIYLAAFLIPLLMSTLPQASIKLTTRCLIEWQLHTMVRPSEAAGTRWDEIDFDKGLWEIPIERMKQKKPHVVPLTPQCLELLEVMKPISSRSEFVFPSGRNPKTHIANAQ